MRRVAATVLAASVLAGCYAGAGRSFTPSRLQREEGWIGVANVPLLKQTGERDCGAAVTAMLLRYWGIGASEAEVRQASGTPPDRGIAAEVLRNYLRARGLGAFLFAGSLGDFERELRAGRPLIVGVLKPYSDGLYAHYQLVLAINREREELVVIDPADGWRVYPLEGFGAEWRAAHFLTVAVVPPDRASASR